MLIILFTVSLLSIGVSSRNWEPDCVGDEFNGVCVEPHECFSTNPYIPGLKYPLPCTTPYGYPGVCCTDCELVNNANDAVLDKSSQTGVLWKTGEKAWDKCLEYVQQYKYRCQINNSMRRKATDNQCHTYFNQSFAPYAVGGSDVSRGEYPHMALLGYQGTKSPSEWLCSGSLISERFILTAAHCIYSRDLGPVTEAAFGVLKRSDPPEIWHKYKIKRVIAHPEYSAPSKYHDIALLETEIPVRFLNETVLPACLPAYEEFIEYNVNPRFDITATGWGDLGYLKSLADTMQKVSLTKFSDEECEDMYPTNRLLKSGLDSSAQMCYGHKTIIRDTCKGDSGGPLQLDTGHPTCMHTIIGVTSYGRECGFQGAGGVYTKVARYMPWIESVVWP